MKTSFLSSIPGASRRVGNQVKTAIQLAQKQRGARILKVCVICLHVVIIPGFCLIDLILYVP